MGDSSGHAATEAQPTRDAAPRPTVAVAPELPPDWNWLTLFGNDRPVELEVGVGKGTFLLNRARAHADRNFFGIEWASEFYRYAVDRMERWHVSNVRLMRTDASYFIREVCPRSSLHVMHVYHPDPWPKRRHHKRRLFQPRFVDAAAMCLVPGGVLRVQTDHAEYFEWLCPLLLGHPQLEPASFDLEDASGAIGSNFETKYLREGRSIYRLAVRRVAAGGA